MVDYKSFYGCTNDGNKLRDKAKGFAKRLGKKYELVNITEAGSISNVFSVTVWYKLRDACRD